MHHEIVAASDRCLFDDVTARKVCESQRTTAQAVVAKKGFKFAMLKPPSLSSILGSASFC